jgi:hypothetical protein
LVVDVTVFCRSSFSDVFITHSTKKCDIEQFGCRFNADISLPKIQDSLERKPDILARNNRQWHWIHFTAATIVHIIIYAKQNKESLLRFYGCLILAIVADA